MTVTPVGLGPVLDTSVGPTDARIVEQLKPDLLLTQEHHMCPGCGEPLAIRVFLEAIQELGLASTAIAVVGIGCYTSFGGHDRRRPRAGPARARARRSPRA